MPGDDDLGRLARGQLVILDFAYSAFTGRGTLVDGEDLIASIGDGELVLAILPEIHFAEVELVVVDHCPTAAGGIWACVTTLPGVLAEFQHGRTGPDRCATRHRYNDGNEDSLACHTYSLVQMKAGINPGTPKRYCLAGHDAV
jgi:hypothetical protein